MTTKTPVEIIQEFIAIHTTRQEMVEKCEGKEFSPDVKTNLQSAEKQSEKYNQELLSELSNFGDAVMAGADNQNEYQVTYKNALGKIDAMTPQETEQTFHSLEIVLKNIYRTVLETQTNLPASLQEILHIQADDINAK